MRPLIFVPLILCACNTQKQTTRSRAEIKTNTELKTIQIDERDYQKAVQLKRAKDTQAGTRSIIDIVPRGAFRISSDGTFEGEALQIRIHRRDTARAREALEINTAEADRGQTQTTKTEKANEALSIQETEKQVERAPNFYIWIGAALGVLLIVAGLRIFTKLIPR
jgi:hypothetical protein